MLKTILIILILATLAAVGIAVGGIIKIVIGLVLMFIGIIGIPVGIYFLFEIKWLGVLLIILGILLCWASWIFLVTSGFQSLVLSIKDVLGDIR